MPRGGSIRADDPVEDRRSRGRLDDLERGVAREDPERSPDSIPGEAAGKGEELAHELEERLAHASGVGTVFQLIGIEGARITIMAVRGGVIGVSSTTL